MKCGQVTVDKDGNVHREEWETEETAEQFLNRIVPVLEAMQHEPPPNALRISPTVYNLLKKYTDR